MSSRLRSPEIAGAWPTLVLLQSGQAAALLVGALSVVVVSRVLGPRQYGSLTLVLTVAQYVVILAVTWTTASVVRFGRDELVRTGQVRRVFGTRLAIAIGCLSAAFVVLWVGRPYAESITGMPPGSIGLILLMALALTLADHVDGTLQAAGAWSGYAWLGAVEKGTFLSIVALAAIVARPSVRTAVMAAVLAQLVRVVSGGVSILRTGTAWPPIVDAAVARVMLRYSWPQLFTFAVGYFSAFVEPFLITKYMDIATVGVYYVAYQASLFCAALLTPAGSMLFPAITSLRVQEREDLLDRLLERLVPQAVFVISLLIAAGMVVAQFAFPVVFGATYAGALGPLQILLVAVSFQTLTILYGPVASAYDMTRETATLNTVGGIAVHLVPELLLIPLFGMYGAAGSWVIWYVSSAVVSVVLVERRLGLKLRFVLAYPLVAVAAALLLLAAGRLGGPLAVSALLIVAVSWIRRQRVFRPEDAELLESLGVPLSIRRPAAFIYRALSG